MTKYFQLLNDTTILLCQLLMVLDILLSVIISVWLLSLLAWLWHVPSTGGPCHNVWCVCVCVCMCVCVCVCVCVCGKKYQVTVMHVTTYLCLSFITLLDTHQTQTVQLIDWTSPQSLFPPKPLRDTYYLRSI